MAERIESHVTVLYETPQTQELERLVRATPPLLLRAGTIGRWTSEPGIFVAVLDPVDHLRRFRVAALGVHETTASPTFSIVNEYRDNNNQPIYHFDFYRIKNESEAFDIGTDEYFDSGNLCLIEWPEKTAEPTRYFFCDLPADYSLRRLVQVAKARWKVEQDYQQLKEELGLDHYEGRSWSGWHHHVTLVMLAHSFLTLETLRNKKNFWVDPAEDAS